MKGSYINIWIVKGSKSRISESDSGVDNSGYERAESNELVSLGFAPIEDRVDDLLNRFGISFVIKTESNKKVNGNDEEVRVLLQVFVPDSDLENILIGLQKCGVGSVAGTGFSLLPTSVNMFGEEEAAATDTVDAAGGDDHKKVDNQSSFHSISGPFKQYKIEKFYRSIKSRLIVAEVIKRYLSVIIIHLHHTCSRIESGAEFSFDFVCFLVVAACLAFMGEC